MNNKTETWQSAALRFLQAKSNVAFTEWVSTNQGKKWKSQSFKRNAKSPYQYGFTLPYWHHDLIAALNSGNECEAKAIKLRNI